MSPKRSWFLAPRAPNFDCSPEGYIALGSLIASPFEPEQPIIPGLPPHLPQDAGVERISKFDWERSLEKGPEGRVGVWATYLGLGKVETGAHWNSTHSEAYRFQQLDIDSFTPSKDWIIERMAVKEVQEYISATKIWRKPIYVIVGVMIARNPAVQKMDSSQWGVDGTVGADLTLAGAPGAQGGPATHISHSRKEKTVSKGSSDFVFAYRLKEIHYRQKAIETQDYRSRGAALNAGEDDVDKAAERAEYAIDEMQLGTQDVSAYDLEIDSLAVADELDRADASEVLVGE